jgi:hypothetical protein
MTPPESCEKAIKSENIAYTSHVVTGMNCSAAPDCILERPALVRALRNFRMLYYRHMQTSM